MSVTAEIDLVLNGSQDPLNQNYPALQGSGGKACSGVFGS